MHTVDLNLQLFADFVLCLFHVEKYFLIILE